MIPKIKEWLEKQGYPLEMKVAQELLKCGFHPLQSNYYKDPESEKNREIDVVGQLGYYYKEYKVFFQIIIECKNNNTKPWITFSSNSHTINNKEFITHRPASRIGDKYLNYVLENDLLKDSKSFVKPETFAYNVTQAFEGESDRTYSALMTVVNAIKFRKNKVNSNHYKNCEIYHPVIVLGGRLFDCHLDENNESVIKEVDHKILLWKNTLIDKRSILIEITTFDSFKKRISILHKEVVELLTKKSDSFFDEDHTNYLPFN